MKRTRRLKFRYMMSRAVMMPIRLIGSDVVTMNTDLLIRTAAGKRLFVRLVYPEWEDRSKNWISVFSWTGLSLLGRKKGDAIRRGLTIDKIIYQPESNNDFHL
jgi:transcription elongation GreA/GreB family factor